MATTQHLLRPGEEITLCGEIRLLSSTTDPIKANCKKCLISYQKNPQAYVNLMEKVGSQ